MAAPAQKPTIEDALAALKRDPTHPVRVHVQDMDVELRATLPPKRRSGESAWPEGWFDVTAGALPDFVRPSQPEPESRPGIDP